MSRISLFSCDEPRRLLLLAGLATILGACRHTNTNNLQVTGGEPDENRLPATVLLTFDSGRTCTGTFVQSDLLLTAAHCVVGETRVTASSSHFAGGEPLVSTRFEYFPGFKLVDGKMKENEVYKDIGFVHFASGSVKSNLIAKISLRVPRVGDRVQLLGYGVDQDPRGGATSAQDVRRYGSNRIAKIRSDINNLILLERGSDSASSAIGATGDSGGALYNEDDEIIGVTNGADGQVSFHVNLLNSDSKAYVEQVLAKTNNTASLHATVKPSKSSYLPRCSLNGLKSFDSRLVYSPDAQGGGFMKLKSGVGFSCLRSVDADENNYFPLCSSVCDSMTSQVRGDWGWCVGVEGFACSKVQP